MTPQQIWSTYPSRFITWFCCEWMKEQWDAWAASMAPYVSKDKPLEPPEWAHRKSVSSGAEQQAIDDEYKAMKKAYKARRAAGESIESINPSLLGRPDTVQLA